jgi:hypothetical protein
MRRAAACKRGINDRVARRGVDPCGRLGRNWWVDERALSWLARYRPLKVRYERRAQLHRAFLELGYALICWNQVLRS